MVPDVAANADPNTGYEIILYGANGSRRHKRGRTALRGLFASFGTKLGFITPELYLNSACFHDVIHGDNGAFRGRMGADPCTGLGSPLGELLEERIQPAAIHASTMRGLIAENAQLQAQIAQFSAAQPASTAPCMGQAGQFIRPANLMARAAAVGGGCVSPAAAYSKHPGLALIKQLVCQYLQRDPNSTPDKMPMTGSGGILATLGQGSFTPISDFAVNCANNISRFITDGIKFSQDVQSQGTTIGNFISYIANCYNLACGV